MQLINVKKLVLAAMLVVNNDFFGNLRVGVQCTNHDKLILPSGFVLKEKRL